MDMRPTLKCVRQNLVAVGIVVENRGNVLCFPELALVFRVVVTVSHKCVSLMELTLLALLILCRENVHQIAHDRVVQTVSDEEDCEFPKELKHEAGGVPIP